MKLFVDSLSLAIPLSSVQIMSGELQAKYKLSSCDSLIIGEGSPSPDEDAYSLDDNPRFVADLEVPICSGDNLGSVYYKIRKVKCGDEFKECILISLSSKMLMTDYYKGIASDTIRELHWFVLSQNVISVSLSDFQGGFVSVLSFFHASLNCVAVFTITAYPIMFSSIFIKTNQG